MTLMTAMNSMYHGCHLLATFIFAVSFALFASAIWSVTHGDAHISVSAK